MIDSRHAPTLKISDARGCRRHPRIFSIPVDAFGSGGAVVRGAGVTSLEGFHLRTQAKAKPPRFSYHNMMETHAHHCQQVCVSSTTSHLPHHPPLFI